MLGALEGVRIVDFGSFWAGPYGLMLLSLMGAEVIKVESSTRPDTMGGAPGPGGQAPTSSYVEINLNKLSVALDLKRPEGVALAKQIVAISDIVAENYRPGVMERLGLGYDALKEIKPDIIMISVSASGATGPERAYTGYAGTFNALSGLAYATGYGDGIPTELRGSIDLRVATMGAFALLVALNHRQRTHEGQYIDLSAREMVSCHLGEVLLDYTMNARVQPRKGNHDDGMAPHSCYPCKGEDRWVTIAVSSEEEWRALCSALGNPAWESDEKFSDAYRRLRNQDALDDLIAAWTRRHSDYEVMEKLQQVGVAAMPCFSSEQLFNDPHLKERDFAAEVQHPLLGKRTVISAPWKFSLTPAKVYRSSPVLGEHNDYVFGDLLHLPRTEIDRLIEEKVIC